MTSDGSDRDEHVCRLCGGRTIPIAYGFPGDDLFEAAERGEIVLGGCVLSGDDPSRR